MTFLLGNSYFIEGGKMSEVQLMTIEEAALFLNLKVSKIRKDIFYKTIPYYKIGSLIRFKKDELLKWLDQKIVPPMNSNQFRS